MNKLTEKLKNLFYYCLRIDNEKIYMCGNELKLPKEEIADWNILVDANAINIIHNGKFIFLIKEVNNVINREQKIEDANLRISISELNEEMSVYLLNNLPDDKELRHAAFRIRRLSEKKDLDIVDIAKSCFPGFYIISVEILREELIDKIDVETIVRSTLFNLSSLQNYNYKLVSNFNEIIEESTPRTIRFRRKNIDVPHLKYSNDLVEYYIEGNSARIPKIQYLSFYNVLEYEFDKMFYDEQCVAIQNITTDPKFNHSNLNSYKKIIKIFDSKNKFSERELLAKLIKKYIEVEDFKEFLEANSFYLNNAAYKIKKTKFSLEDSDDKIREKIRDRIYGIRNALVHSKESNEEKYLPQEIKNIIPELDLIKYLAEQIIIKTAKKSN